MTGSGFVTGRTLQKISAAIAAALLAAVLAAPASAAPVLPDLVADPADGERLQQDMPGNRLLLRFNGYIHNAGPGELRLRGTEGADRLMGSVKQEVFDSDGVSSALLSAPLAQLRYETGDGHNHWHLMRIADYRLTSLTAGADVAPAQKVGFCLVDSEPTVSNPRAAKYPDPHANCLTNTPGASSVVMGLTPGWRDIYEWFVNFQWVDASEVQPGLYRLRSDVDPLNAVKEVNEVNPPGLATQTTAIPGYRARPSTVTVTDDAPRTFSLASDAFAHADWTPGERQLKIVTPPEHGTLSVAAGTWFTDPQVVYTPQPGGPADDRFTFIARDRTSAFPRTPAAATITLNDPADDDQQVSISGAPARMRAGTSVQLSAAVTGRMPHGVTWSVAAGDGVGSVTPTGLYRAPAAVPAGGAATVLATSAEGATASVRIAIDPVEPFVAAPSVEPPAGETRTAPPQPGGGQEPQVVAPRTEPQRPLPTLGIAAQRHGPLAVASVSVRRAGTVTVTLRSAGRPVGRCRFNAAPGRAYTCRVDVPTRPKRLEMIAILRSPGRAALLRRVPVRAAHTH